MQAWVVVVVVGRELWPAGEDDSATMVETAGEVEEKEVSSDADAVVIVMETGRGNPNASLGPLEAEDEEEVVDASDRFRSLGEEWSGRFICRPRRKRGRLMQ